MRRFFVVTFLMLWSFGSNSSATEPNCRTITMNLDRAIFGDLFRGRPGLAGSEVGPIIISKESCRDERGRQRPERFIQASAESNTEAVLKALKFTPGALPEGQSCGTQNLNLDRGTYRLYFSVAYCRSPTAGFQAERASLVDVERLPSGDPLPEAMVPAAQMPAR